MATLRILPALLLSTLFSFQLLSQSRGSIDDESIIQILYQHASDDTPGIAVGIVKGGAIVYRKFIGYANLEHEIAINEKTRFNIASNAKQFTALCILKLVEQGKISLDDDIRKYLPGLYAHMEDPITLSSLITHTSGIRDVYELWSLKGKTWWKLFVDNDDAMELIKSQKDLNFKSKTAYLYSNSNYILLAEIINELTGESFGEFSKSMFLEMGMSDTDFLTNYMTVIPHKARPYGNWNGWREYPIITETHGDGALFTTLDDQLKWEQIIQLNDGEFFSQNLIDQSQEPITNSFTRAYGYGLMFGKYKGLNYTYHDGNTGAYNATFLRFPAKNLSIVVNSNNGNVPTHYLAKQLADAILGLEKNDPTYPSLPERIERLKNTTYVLGHYRNEDGTIIKITEKEESIYREIYQRTPAQLIKEKEGLFHYASNQELKMNFSNINQTDQQLTIYLSSQPPSTYYKIPTVDLSKIYKQALNGNYYNAENDTEIVVSFKEDNTYSITKNGRERKGELLYEDYLRMNAYEIKVTRNSEGGVSGLNVNNNRIKNVMFEKRMN